MGQTLFFKFIFSLFKKSKFFFVIPKVLVLNLFLYLFSLNIDILIFLLLKIFANIKQGYAISQLNIYS